MTDDRLVTLLKSRHLGVLATLMKDGRPQMSTITYGTDDTGSTIRISVTADRVKTRNVSRDPRAALHVTGESAWSWVVAEGRVELSPVATDPDDATVDDLVSYYRDISGEHPDWEEYRQAMVADGRQLLRLHVDKVYGQAG